MIKLVSTLHMRVKHSPRRGCWSFQARVLVSAVYCGKHHPFPDIFSISDLEMIQPEKWQSHCPGKERPKDQIHPAEAPWQMCTLMHLGKSQRWFPWFCNLLCSISLHISIHISVWVVFNHIYIIHIHIHIYIYIRCVQRERCVFHRTKLRRALTFIDHGRIQTCFCGWIKVAQVYRSLAETHTAFWSLSRCLGTYCIYSHLV